MMKQSSTKGGRLPNNKFTKSDKVYVREWKKYAKFICNHLNKYAETDQSYVCGGFDPGVLIYVVKDNKILSGSTINVTGQLNSFFKRMYYE